MITRTVQQLKQKQHFDIPNEAVLIDACCLEDISLDELAKNPQYFLTTNRVMSEIENWIAKERKDEVLYDKHTKTPRPGYAWVIDEKLELGDRLAEARKNGQNTPKLERRITELANLYEQNKTAGQKFFHAVKGYQHFRDLHPENVIHPPGGAREEIKRYSKLLTKNIIADALATYENRQLFEQKDYATLRDVCKKIYEQRLNELNVETFVTDERKTNTERGFYSNLTYLANKTATRSIHGLILHYKDSLNNDLALVQTAYDKQFATEKVCVYTKDRDIAEMVDYLNAAKEAGYVKTRNEVRCYASK